jgi:signal transduction histidine kinase
LMLALGFAWIVAGLQFSAHPGLGYVGVLGGWVWAAVLAHLTLAFPSGRLVAWPERAVVGTAYFVATLGEAARVLVADAGTFRPAACEGCPGPFVSLASSPDLAQSLVAVQRGVAALLTVAIGALMVMHWQRGSSVQRRALAPVLSVGAFTATVIAGSVGALSVGLVDLGRALQWPFQVGVILVPLAFLGGMLRTRLERAVGVSRLVDQLAALPSPDRLRAALAEALGDPTLAVVYWLPAAGAYVDSQGEPVVLPGAGSNRAATLVEVAGAPVAALVHDAGLGEEASLVRAAGRAAALWLDRERLEVEGRARILDLRESRARLVEAGDAERRRIERDLHDGAQHRLAALLLHVQLERRTFVADEQLGENMLNDIERELGDALTDLRALAAGILPPVLSDYGLEAALDDLTCRFPVTITVERLPIERLPTAIEVAAYFIIAEALANVAKHSNATSAAVRVSCDRGCVIVEAQDDGVGGASLAKGTGIRGLADRVGALDGTIVCHSPPGRGTLLRAEIPCAL